MELDLCHHHVQFSVGLEGFWRRESLIVLNYRTSTSLHCPEWLWVSRGCLEWVTLPGAEPALVFVFQLTALKHSKKAEEQKLSEVQQRLEELEPVQEKVKE